MGRGWITHISTQDGNGGGDEVEWRSGGMERVAFVQEYHVKCKQRKEQRDNGRMWGDKVRKQRWAVVGNSFVKISLFQIHNSKSPPIQAIQAIKNILRYYALLKPLFLPQMSYKKRSIYPPFSKHTILEANWEYPRFLSKSSPP